jgi:2-dehydropantoate 2-reductase
MRVAVIGAGAIGGWIAARLALAGNEVMALTSRGPVERLEISDGGDTAAATLSMFEEPTELLVIAVKAPALPGVAPTLGPLIRPETLIVPMLNGVPWWFVEGEPLRSIDPDGTIAASLPMDQIIGCVVHASCSRPAPERIVVRHADKLIIGEHCRSGPAAGQRDRARHTGAPGVRCFRHWVRR